MLSEKKTEQITKQTIEDNPIFNVKSQFVGKKP